MRLLFKAWRAALILQINIKPSRLNHYLLNPNKERRSKAVFFGAAFCAGAKSL
jgi:hypothetical protein